MRAIGIGLITVGAALFTLVVFAAFVTYIDAKRRDR